MSALIIWVLIVHFIEKSSQMDCKRDIVKNTVFNCAFRLNSLESNLECENAFTQFDSPESYFVLQLYKSEDNVHIIDLKETFRTFLHSTFSTKSRFYSCDAIWRDFIAGNPTLLSENCKRYDGCVQQASSFINGSDVKSVEILNMLNIDSFEGLDQFPRVTDVIIKDTVFVNISSVDFGSPKWLNSLNLKNSNIKYLYSGIFVRLHSLEYLDLSQNKIRAIMKSHFGKLEKLKSLNLSFNSISDFSYDAFTGFSNLQEIYLMSNKFLTIDASIFKFNKYLIKIDLSYNNLKLLPEPIFHSLQDLEDISCSRCKLVALDSKLFRNSTKLKTIDFSKNDIDTIPSGLFEKQHYMFILDLRSNRISEIPELRNKTYLKYLDLSQNEISSLDENFSKEAIGLYLFNISKNRLKVLVDSHVKYFKDLEVFDLSYNNITLVQLGTTIDVKIRKLQLSNNFITVLKVEWRKFSYLEELVMEYNKLTHLVLPPCIPSVKQTITFYFQHNIISKVDANYMIKDQNRVKTNNAMAGGCFFNGLSKNFVDISNNPLICDCTLYPLYNYLKHEKGVKLDTFINLRNMTCFSPKILKNKPIYELTDDALSCYFTTNCPKPCLCGVRGKDNQTFVNCSATGLDEIPQDIPLQTTVLYFNLNKLSQLKTLNSSSWVNLIELHADYNKLITLVGWKIPQRLKYLSLKGNKIKNLPKALMNFISNQSNFELFFGGNDKYCNCSKKPLQQFIIENAAFVKDIDDVICEIDSNGTTSTIPLHALLNEVLCPKTIRVNFDSKVTIISMSIVFILLLSILLIYYKQRQLILSFLYMYCNEVFHVCFEENEADDDKVFDAFIAYSSCDRLIVMDILQELEEKEPHFQLCIHERNWLPGRFISDNIISSVQNSKRTIVILSNNFIASPWFRLELRAAIFKVSGDRKNKIIVILVDKSTSLKEIDTELRHVISKRTYLVWGERWFWEKLRYVMPRKSCLENSEENHSENAAGNRRESEIPLMEDI